MLRNVNIRFLNKETKVRKKPITAGGLTIEVESFMLVVGQEKTKTIRSFRMGNTNTFLPTVQVLLEQNLKKSF